jgi:primary-amine oxidase
MVHPLAILSEAETNLARDVVKAAHPGTVIDFREIFLQEPPKKQVQEFLALEHAGRLSPTTLRPPRLALCQYDVIGADRIPEFHESVVDVASHTQVNHTVVGKQHHASLTLYGCLFSDTEERSLKIPTGASSMSSWTNATSLPCSKKPCLILICQTALRL